MGPFRYWVDAVGIIGKDAIYSIGKENERQEDRYRKGRNARVYE
jgi:hypothetical protein